MIGQAARATCARSGRSGSAARTTRDHSLSSDRDPSSGTGPALPRHGPVAAGRRRPAGLGRAAIRRRRALIPISSHEST